MYLRGLEGANCLRPGCQIISVPLPYESLLLLVLLQEPIIVAHIAERVVGAHAQWVEGHGWFLLCSKIPCGSLRHYSREVLRLGNRLLELLRERSLLELLSKRRLLE